ncbi:hypothetical protein [Pleomorphomonas sp. JP5]|uniref:hypothetical protein n=1 Tax=Pleomorphomonas sp. JP5 TaxID=2942998 RepID=UPI0020431533|nr:hypothetical protein [Pleomorphomonas sp. JP5]MCM5560351.1 hypothetical protein [Pleomorphomonas sp. JP5]
MTFAPIHLAMVLAALAIASPTLAAEKRHQFIEPIQPDRRKQETMDSPQASDKLCYCRTIHERNSAGRLTWKVVCSERKPEHGSRKVLTRGDCGVIRNLSP